MPRRALRCRVDLKIRAVTAPGVWLCSREDVYLSISMFGEYKTTNLVPSIFPLFVKEDLCFDKTYYTALDPSDVAKYLEDELVIIELLQLREDCDGAIRLATYSSNARDFLFPYPSLAPAYASNTRELLMSRTLDFPGIAPKIEFVTVTNISESLSPELDRLEDALRQERKSRRRSRSRSRPSSRNSMRTYIDVDEEEDQKNYHKPTVASVFRSRSPSPAFGKKYEQVGISKRPLSASSTVGRPPFVVRHLEKSLIGRTPGAGGPVKGKKGKKKVKRSSRPSSALSDTEYYSDYASPKYRLKKVLRDSGDDPMPVYQSRYIPSDEDDAEVAALTNSVDNLYIPPRSRSPSPLLYRTSLRERYGGGLTPAERVELRVKESLRRSRELLRSLTPPPRRYSPYRTYSSDSLDNLEIDTSIVKSRSEKPYVHLDNGKYWTERAAKFTAKSHRQIFNDTLSSSYQKMYKNAY